ncbi:hypothetical protein GCM10023317_53780 [Actinopolymorpha pittospori]
MRAEALTAVIKPGEWLQLATSAGNIGDLWRGHETVNVKDILDVELDLSPIHRLPGPITGRLWSAVAVDETAAH